MTDETTALWDDISYVISSKYRCLALMALTEGSAPPTQIASDMDVGLAHISRALRELREREIVELLVSEDTHKGRVYMLSEYGKNLWARVEAENMVPSTVTEHADDDVWMEQ